MINQENAITTERVRILYERAFASINTALAASLIISYIVWDRIDSLVLLTWLGVMFAVALVRYWLLFDYNKNKQNILLQEKFENRYSYATALVGICWAFIIVSSLYLPDFEYRIYGILLLASIIAISVPIFSSSPKTIFFYVTPSLITAIPLLLFRGGNDAAIGLALIVFTIMVLRTSKDTYKTLIDTLSLRYQTQMQAEKLSLLNSEKKVNEQRLFLYREQSPLGVIEWNTDFEFIDWNPAAERIFGFSRDEVKGHHITDKILPESARATVNKIWQELLENKGGIYSLNENLTKDGRIILCEWHNTPLVDENGKVFGVTSIVDDVTEREKREENLRHSQKMEAIGKLTGGIAHDFNNMLSVILGFSGLLKKTIINNDTKGSKYCANIITAAEHAKLLTAKLLDFSRKEPSYSEIADINDSLQGMQYMLESTITPRIELIFELEEKLWPVMLSKRLLEDAVLNMCINSMHAIPASGKLTLRTSNMHIDNSDINNFDIEPGDYVLLSISDTGLGMTNEIQEKMFDPFFTTKNTEGTGLGLSQVYGFVKQSGGRIQVYSEPEHGTRIVLYFPRNLESESAETKDDSSEYVEIPFGKETILVVDDEVILLELTKEILTQYGYSVLCAESGSEALETLKDNSVDLVLSDVIMPGMNGFQLAEEVSKHYPAIKIQMLSGFSDNVNTSSVNQMLLKQLLQKPVSTEKLLKQIRNLLDEE